MQTTEKQSKESGKVRLSFLVAVVLASASAGVWSELRAASAPSRIVSQSISANSPDFSTAGVISENGDGTAFILVFAPVGDTTQALGTIYPAVTNHTLGVDYTISTQFKPGQSGNTSASATGQFTINPAYTFDINTFEQFGPYACTVDLAVANATQVGTFIQQGVTATVDPQTRQISIVRQHIIGDQATGDTAGSVTVSLDGNVVAQTTEGFGMAQADTTHTIQRIH